MALFYRGPLKNILYLKWGAFLLPKFSCQLALLFHVSDQSFLRESKSITHITIKGKVLWLWLVRRQSIMGSHGSREQQP